MLMGVLLSAAMAVPDAKAIQARAKDWRNGAIVYQVFVDRFAPSANLDGKRSLYPAPAVLRDWTQTPKPSSWDPKIQSYPHVFEFWGGDLESTRSKLDYLQRFGADVLYLLPIFTSPTNHKYDTEDYHEIDPQYGSHADLQRLIKDLHRRGMKIMLDGVFNHIGVTSPIFQKAKDDPKDPRRDWFFFDKSYERGYRGWSGVPTMPGLKLETPGVRDFLWKGKDSVVRRYLKDGIDGWRLDVAFELGPDLLRDLTKSAHAQKKGSAVVGEISGYPSNWFDAVDGVFNFASLAIGQRMLSGAIRGGQAGRMYADMVADAGLENLLKSWILPENHDTPRLASLVKDVKTRNLIAGLQFTLPGAPCVYYGLELGMEGQGDPQNRAPMRWDLVREDNPDYAFMKKLIQIRKAHPALRYGDFTALQSDKLLAFSRTTDKLRDTVFVLMNPTDEKVKEVFPGRVGRILSWGELRDQLGTGRARSINGMIEVEVPARSMMIMTLSTDPYGGYSPYDRVG